MIVRYSHNRAKAGRWSQHQRNIEHKGGIIMPVRPLKRRVYWKPFGVK